VNRNFSWTELTYSAKGEFHEKKKRYDYTPQEKVVILPGYGDCHGKISSGEHTYYKTLTG
jgi:hypothetical protein